MSEKNVLNRRYTEEFKEEAARPADSIGHNKAVRRLDVPVATIGNWARRRRTQGAVAAVDMALPVTRAKLSSRSWRKRQSPEKRIGQRQIGAGDSRKGDGIL